MDAIPLVLRPLQPAWEDFSPSTAYPDVQELPATLYATVQTRWDLRAIRPIAKRQPSTDLKMKPDWIPSNVHSHSSTIHL